MPVDDAPVAIMAWRSASRKLFDNGHEEFRIEDWTASDTKWTIANPRGLELLVLDGDFSDGHETFHALSWLRLPPGTHLKARTGTMARRVGRSPRAAAGQYLRL